MSGTYKKDLADPGGIAGGKRTPFIDPSGWFGKKDPIVTNATKVAGIQLQTSTYGSALPLVYGTTRVAGMLVDYDDFTPHAVTTTTQQGGKGGAPPSQSNNYTYTCGVILAICEGPITGITQVWADKEVGTLSSYGFTSLTGTNPQSPWSTWSTLHPAKALGYAGMALACASAISLGETGMLKNNNFEVVALFATQQDPAFPTAYDARPYEIITDFLTHSVHGAGFARLGSLSTGAASYATYCQAAGIVLSPPFFDQKAAREHVQEILDATNSVAVWSAGSTGNMELKVVPYADQPITANGAIFTPNTTPLYDFTYDDFLGVVDRDGNATGNDAVSVSRSSTQEVFNCCPVEFADRSQAYNASVVDDPDPVDVAINGLKKASALTYHCITKASVALQVSRIRAQRNVYIRNRYTWQSGWKHILLEPMDLVTLTDAKLGLDHKVVRLLSIEMPDEGSEENGLTFSAEEWPFGVASPTTYTTQYPGGAAPNANASPGNANAPVIFDVPALYRNGKTPEIMVGTSGGAMWGGCEIWASADNATYVKVGQISRAARHGTLAATMAAGSAVQDTTSTCAVDLTVSGGTLPGVTAAVATDLQSLCWCDGELFAYQAATLTAANKYTLGTLLVRGGYGTSQSSHASGTKFVRVDDSLSRIELPVSHMGQLTYIKLVSFNIWGGGMQDISTVPVYTYTPVLQSYPGPYNVAITITTTPPTKAKGQAPLAPLDLDQVKSGGTSIAMIPGKSYVKVTWAFPAGAPIPSGFRVTAYTGADPADSSTYLFTPVSVGPADTSLVVTLATVTDITAVNAAVKAIYA